MADEIDYKIHGDDMQMVAIELDSQEGVRAEAGAMMYMEDGIEMQTGTGGGLFSGFKRMITGESFFITTFMHQGAGKSHVSFAAPYPGKIIALNLSAIGGSFLVRRMAFCVLREGLKLRLLLLRKLVLDFLVERVLSFKGWWGKEWLLYTLEEQ